MMKAIVTLRFPRNPAHDPRNKVTDKCPLSAENAQVTDDCGCFYCTTCTDATGEHHSYLETGQSLGEISEKAKQKFPKALHITRIEAIA